MDKKHCKRELLITIALPITALFLNWQGMGSAPLTLGRAMGLGGYALLALFLCLWTLSLLERAVSLRGRSQVLSALLALVVLCLLLIWPFTPAASRLNHLLYYQQREAALQSWQEGALQQVGSTSWYVGPGSWDRKLYVEERGEAFIFRIYNGILWSCDAVYSPGGPLKDGNDRVESLGGGWYWILDH